MVRALALVLLAAATLGSVACSGGRSAPDFALQSDRSTPWQLSAQHGKAVLLTFGFTHCPDTCPTILARMVRATAALGARAGNVEIAFVTVDPSRDTAPVLHRFVNRFARPGVDIVGLTGTPLQIAAAEAAYHVWAAKIHARKGSYDVAHSAAIFVIDPSGRFHGVLDDQDSEGTVVAALRKALG
ncbi:MAG TPA: SCO family protein [Candidatus Cybelea sp.]|jgi:protein SCO1/2|nr:SCO family protein [Candidatus Cybelea sp.]